MTPLEVVRSWDAALRAGAWTAARALLTDDAEYHTPEAADPDYDIDCSTPDEIIDLMASFKGQMPDIEVVRWAEYGDDIVARLRQPEWGMDADWWQVLNVRGDKIARLTDFASESSALGSIGRS